MGIHFNFGSFGIHLNVGVSLDFFLSSLFLLSNYFSLCNLGIMLHDCVLSWQLK